jgi:hypothetical protein
VVLAVNCDTAALAAISKQERVTASRFGNGSG